MCIPSFTSITYVSGLGFFCIDDSYNLIFCPDVQMLLTKGFREKKRRYELKGFCRRVRTRPSASRTRATSQADRNTVDTVDRILSWWNSGPLAFRVRHAHYTAQTHFRFLVQSESNRNRSKRHRQWRCGISRGPVSTLFLFCKNQDFGTEAGCS